MKYLIKNSRLIDPVNKKDEVLDILISNGKIEKIGKNISDNSAVVIDAKGKITAPAFIDMHTHFREPGFEYKETIYTGSKAALKGGFTTVVTMPNTEPATDSVETVNKLKEIIKKTALVNIEIAAAITKNREGDELTDFAELKKLGIKAISDDGSSVADDRIMRLALKEAKKNELLIISHCEDKKLSAGGVMNAGFTASKLGLKGIPKKAEYEFVERDIELAKGLDARVHIAHVSCKESCEIIKKAKKDGVKVTAETAPHYFTLTEESCQTYDTRTKMNPPLRTEKDVDAIIKSLADGTIDIIATDHAPHGFHDKYVEFDRADFGIIGLETALPLAVEKLIEPKVISWTKLIELMSVNPAKILGLSLPSLAMGEKADIVIIDPKKDRKFTLDDIESKSKNSPFLKRKMKGFAEFVFLGGKMMLKEGKVV